MGRLSTSLCDLVSADWSARLSSADRAAMTEIVRVAFIDTAACIMAGRDDPASGLATSWIAARHAAGHHCSVAFGPHSHACVPAAVANGVHGHALDFDDAGLAGHPSVVLMPVIWALHERHGWTGFDLVQAYAKGYALWAELQRRQTRHLHAIGWHPTAVFGTLAATAAVASLHRLDSDGVRHAIGVAASMAGGVIGNFGSMTKSLHAGLAADRAIAACELASIGFSAGPDALDGPVGLLRALAQDDGVDVGSPCRDDAMFALLRSRPGIKKYPVCYAAHRIIDGVLSLAKRHRIDPGEVDSVEVTISPTTAAVMKYHAPTTVTEARFSAEFCVASALLHGGVGLSELDATVVESPDVRRLSSVVRVQTVDTACPLEPSFAFADRVRIRRRDAIWLDSGEIRFAKGHAQYPIDEHQLMQKFRGCLRRDEVALGDSILQRIDTALAT